MERKLSLPKNKLKAKISVIILAAGEGTRISDFIQNIPKPMIKVNNKPLLMHIISNLTSPEISSINIITGHLGNEIKKFILSLKKINTTLYEKIVIIDSGEDYKKGSLYSFLSIANKPILEKDKFFLVIPGDTYFEPDLFTEIFSKIQKDFNIIEKYSIIFYQNIQGIELKSNLNSKRRISIVTIERFKSKEILKEITQKTINGIRNNEEVNQILPVFIFNYELMKRIIEVEKDVSATTIREIINHFIQKENYTIFAYPISSGYTFIDVDTKSELKTLQKKKDNRGSD